MYSTMLRTAIFFLIGGLLVLCIVYMAWSTFPYYNETSLSVFSNDTQVEDDTSSIVFTGDIFLGRDVEHTMNQYGSRYPFSLFTEFATSDAVVINLESPIPLVHTPVPSMGMNFSVASTTVPFLREAGVTHVSLSNNHTWDKGVSGFENTQKILLENGLTSFGHPNTVGEYSLTTIPTVQGEVALIGLHTLFAEPDISAVAEVFSTYAPEAVARIVYIHWGEEYTSLPSAGQKQYAQDLVDVADIDVLIGHHPHVVQTVELIDGVPIFYSLGNTIFDQYFSLEVQTGLVLELLFDTAGNRQVILHPISSLGSRNKPYLMPAREKTSFLRQLSERSDRELQPALQTGEMSW